MHVVFVRLWVPEVDEQPIAEVLGDVTFMAQDDFLGGGLVGADDLAQYLGIEASGERR